MTIDLTGSSPLRRQMADHLRQRIRAGEFQPAKPGGDPRLPSRADLEAEYGVSSTTVRDVVEILEAEGLLWSAGGRGVFVRQPIAQRVVSSQRYRQHERAGFLERHGIEPGEFTMDPCRFRTVPAGGEVGELLAIDPVDQVLERYQVLRARGLAEEIRTGYFPLWLVGGTPFMDSGRQPVAGGLIAELTAAEVGVTFRSPDGLVERIRTRPATPEEAEILRIPSGWGVLISDPRIAYDDHDRPVAVERIIYPGERTIIEVHISLGQAS